MWDLLQDNNTNIYYTGVVLKAEAQYRLINLETATSNDIRNVFAGYNGTGREAAIYGYETSKYYDLFVWYNTDMGYSVKGWLT